MFLGESAMFIGLVFMLFFGALEMIDAFKNAARIFGGNTTEEVDKE